jgi:stage III sporulation protein AG
MSENVIVSMKKHRKYWLPAVGAAVGVSLLLLGSFGTEGEKKEAQREETLVFSADPQAYAEEVERQVVEICSRVKGVDRVEAVVTLGGGYRALYASDSQSSSSGYKSSTVLIGSGSNEEPILLGYENPRIVGIGIVCDGAEDPAVRQSILALVSAAFDVGTNKIYIAAGKLS